MESDSKDSMDSIGSIDSIDPSSFRRALRWLAAGVAIVTVRNAKGEPCGLTATSVCLVSWQPPLLLVCIECASECHTAFAAAPAFAVHLLRADQRGLSRRFAQKHHAKFTGLEWRAGQLSAPVLKECLAHVECRAAARYPAGDHTILLGEAVTVGMPAGDTPPEPLLYFRGQYARLIPDEG